MTEVRGLDWLADDEGNLRPEAAEVLEANPALTRPLPREIPPEVRAGGRFLVRGLLAALAIWAAGSFIEWVVLAAFAVGLLVRLSRWTRGLRPGARGERDRRGRAAARTPSEGLSGEARRGEAPEDPDPVLGIRGRRQ